jgi:hypothetical protein
MGERGAEKRHDAVAHDTTDRAFVSMHGLHHAVEYRLQKIVRLFRIAVGDQLCRPLHVGKQHGYLFAFALQHVLGSTDSLG